MKSNCISTFEKVVQYSNVKIYGQMPIMFKHQLSTNREICFRIKANTLWYLILADLAPTSVTI